jgi:hypothetical protein
LVNLITVGTRGNYATLKEAVDWFNTSATNNTEILIDGGSIPISSTIVVNNPTYVLEIHGLAYEITTLGAATGLSGTPMFRLQSYCNIRHFSATGSTLAGYGSSVGENFMVFETPEIYCEIQDFQIDTFYIGFLDVVGVSYFMYDFTIIANASGAQVSYTTTGIPQQRIDIELGNFTNCPIGVNLLQTGTPQQFIIEEVIFDQEAGAIGVNYVPGVGGYTYGTLANIISCSSSQLGVFLNGFDFTIVRDANVEVIGCIGVEDKTPLGKINVSDNTDITTITTAGTYYKINITDTSTTSCKIGFDSVGGQMIYFSDHPYDLVTFISGNITDDNSGRNIIVALRRNLKISTVTGDGSVVTVTTLVPYNLTVGQTIEMDGWTGGAGVWNGTVTIATVILSPSSVTFTYLASGNGTSTGGTTYVFFSPMSVRADVNTVYAFSMNAIIQYMLKNDTIDLCVTTDGSGDQVIISDLNWLMKK